MKITTETTAEELIERRTAIAAEIEQPDADLDALETELREINAEIEKRRVSAEQAEETRKKIADGAGETKEESEKEPKEMAKSLNEIRNSKEYINAYAEYVKKGGNDAAELRRLLAEGDEECRALLTENAATGTVPVPEFVDNYIHTAWEKDEIVNRVRKTYVAGNLKVGFEISADGAVVHTEGSGAVNEENLVLGIVNLVPVSVKKWVSVSDEAMDLGGENFLRYVMDELIYQIVKKIAALIVADIIQAPAASTTTAVGVPVITATSLSIGLVANALGQLSDEASDPVVIMNKGTWAALKAVQYAGNFNVDPFEGRPVVFNDSLKAFSAATTGDTYMIVGDLGRGAHLNFPNGEGVNITVDRTTLMTSDLARVLGRQFVAHGVTTPGAFVKIKK